MPTPIEIDEALNKLRGELDILSVYACLQAPETRHVRDGDTGRCRYCSRWVDPHGAVLGPEGHHLSGDDLRDPTQCRLRAVGDARAHFAVDEASGSLRCARRLDRAARRAADHVPITALAALIAYLRQYKSTYAEMARGYYHRHVLPGSASATPEKRDSGA